MSNQVGMCASHEVGGPFTLGRQLLSLAGSAAGRFADARNCIVRAVVEPSAGVDVGMAELPLSLTVDPQYRTRYFGDNHYRFIAHALAGLVERGTGSAQRVIEICHAEHADATDRELLRIFERRAGSTGLKLVTASSAYRSGADHYPDPIWRAMREVPQVTGAAALRSWHDARAAELGAPVDVLEHRHAVVHHLLSGTQPEAAVPHVGDLLLAAVRLGFYEAALRRGRLLFEGRPWPDAFDAAFAWRLTAYGIALAASGRRGEALRLHRAATERWDDPELHATAHYVAAMAHARHGRSGERDLDQALRSLDQATAAAERIADPRRRAHRRAFLDNALALVEMHRGNARRAVALIGTGLRTLDVEFDLDEKLQHRVVSRSNRATLLLRLGDVRNALADLDYVVAADPSTPEYRVERAIASHAAGSDGDALRDLTFAIENCVPGPEAHHDRAMLRLASGDQHGAIDDLRMAHDLDPADPDVLAMLCETLIATDLLVEAETRLREWDADDERREVLLARLAVVRDDHSGALRTLSSAIERGSGSPLLYVERSTVLHQVGRADDALADLDLAKVSGAPSALVLANRITVLAECGRAVEAHRAAAELLASGEVEDDISDHVQRVLAKVDVSGPGA